MSILVHQFKLYTINAIDSALTLMRCNRFLVSNLKINCLPINVMFEQYVISMAFKFASSFLYEL